MYDICACASYLLPRPCAVGFPGAVHSRLVLSEVDKCRRKACKVGHIVVQELGCFIHPLFVTSIAHLEGERQKN